MIYICIFIYEQKKEGPREVGASNGPMSGICRVSCFNNQNPDSCQSDVNDSQSNPLPSLEKVVVTLGFVCIQFMRKNTDKVI